MKPYWKILLYFYMLLSLFGAIQKPDDLRLFSTINDKVIHFMVFFFMSFLVLMAYRKMPTVAKVSIPLTYGALIEIVQYFVPYRNASIGDFAADAGGVFCFFIFTYAGKIINLESLPARYIKKISGLIKVIVAKT